MSTPRKSGFKTITAHDIAARVHITKEEVVLMFQYITESLARDDVDRVRIEGWGALRKFTPKPRMMKVPFIPEGKAPAGGKPVIRYIPSPKALSYIRAGAKKAKARGTDPTLNAKLLYGGGKYTRKLKDNQKGEPK